MGGLPRTAPALLTLLFVHVSLLKAASAGIDSISPACASIGAKVTITGNGFGAANVAVTVGGVAAPVVSATGHDATFIVPAGAQLGATTVTATNPGGQTGSIAFKVCDLLVPDSWAGQWQITVTYRDPMTGTPREIDTTTDFIRSGEPFGLSAAVQRGSCTGSASDTQFLVQCTGLATIFTCSLAASVQISAKLVADTITGSGLNSRIVSGTCGPLENANQTIEITGHRLSSFQDPLGPPTTLVQSFVPFGGLITGTP